VSDILLNVLGQLWALLLVPLIFAIAAAILLEGFRGFLKGLWQRWILRWVDRVATWVKQWLTVDASDIVIKLRHQEGDGSAVFVDMNSAPPEIRLWFEVANNSHFNLTLDRLLITVKSVGLNLLAFDRGILERVKIPKKRTTENLCYFAYLDAELAERIGQQATFVQNLNRWEIRIMVQANGFFHARWVGWITTGQRTIFVHDAFPIAGTPPKRVIPVSPEELSKVEHKKLLKELIGRLSTGLTRYAQGDFRSPDDMPQLYDDLSRLKVECPDLFFHVDEIAKYIGNIHSPRDAGYVHEKLLTPLIFDARRYMD
jgi:hypothetical protein